MLKEHIQRTEVVLSLSSLVALVYALNSAFSLGVRKQVGTANHWTCERCGKRFVDGWVVHVCHYDHDKRNPKYDDPTNAWLGCVACHLLDHITRAGTNGLTLQQNNYGIHKLENTQQRTVDWQRKHGYIE